MQKPNQRRINRVRSLVILCVLTAIVLTVSTYAWFVGMRTVNVSSFDVEIAGTDSLALSLDGSTWNTTVTISQATFSSVSYTGNTNSWGGEGLVPMSSIGHMDATASRMKLFEKASLTATPGGYRLLSSRVHNYEPENGEQSGYVAFDLFVRNLSGTQYIEELNLLDEEAIYLTVDSEVVVASVGGVAETGIENSVRVAFAQIGRVIATTTDQNTITGITCSDAGTVTGICRTAQIWEPNDTFHESNAISWYETSCLSRIAADVTDPDSYSGSCGLVIDGKAYPTYAVSTDIASSDRVDIYDGAEYNAYKASTPIVAYPYFTDTDKFLTGTSRPTFMTLAPNSITKIRVYIYIEGQDIDNYDFAAIGRKISVKFGFTKERLTEDDIDYNGPDLNQGQGPSAADMTAPVITLVGDDPMEVLLNGNFTDPGATATDNVDTTEAMTAAIDAYGTVNPNVLGEYKITYKVIDTAGNMGIKTRIVNVVESLTP